MHTAFAKGTLITALWTMLVVLLLYKLVYPYPDFMPDSYFYIRMADAYGLVPQLWPVGYGWFLHTLHFISHSHYLLVVLQYLMLQLSSIWLLYTLTGAMELPARIVRVLLGFLIVNPWALYEANIVSSDAPFTALSLCWLTMLLQMVVGPRIWHFLLQPPLLTYLIVLRHQAIYYPLLLLIALAIVRYAIVWKVLTVAMAALLIGWFVESTRQANEKKIGIKVFSEFGGWQMANNALYMYPHVEVDTANFDNTPQELIDRQVRNFLDTTDCFFTPRDGPEYMLAFKGAMKHYQFKVLPRQYPKHHALWYYQKAGQEFGVYGRQLIAAHPFAFLRYYLLPNIGTYLLPNLEKFLQYNDGVRVIWPEARRWFGLAMVHSYWVKGAYYLIGICRYVFLLLNIYLCVAIVIAWRRKIYRSGTAVQQRLLFFVTVAFVGNAVFSILAAPVMMRYQLYAMILGVILAGMLWGRLSNGPAK